MVKKALDELGRVGASAVLQTLLLTTGLINLPLDDIARQLNGKKG